MAQIGHGYGSEWQLLRMLGHHRDYFFKELREQIGISSEDEIRWLDYGWDDGEISGDKEFVGRDFFHCIPHIFTQEIMAGFSTDDFGKNLRQNWDGIFWVGNTVYLVEAKAHIDEIKSDCMAGSSKSIGIISTYMDETKAHYGITSDSDWTKIYYQMANRMAFLALLEKHRIDARLVNIYFIDGYEKKSKDPDSGKYHTLLNKNASKEDWKRVIKEEEEYLGIADRLNGKAHFVFVNCKGNATGTSAIQISLDLSRKVSDD